jgi:hypothetical protein
VLSDYCSLAFSRPSLSWQNFGLSINPDFAKANLNPRGKRATKMGIVFLKGDRPGRTRLVKVLAKKRKWAPV